VAGDIALHYYPVNAVYLAGGIAPKIRGMLASQAFIEAFTNKGPMRNNLQKVPVKLVLNDSPGLDGAIAYARQRYMQA
jgi:glucokinase